MLSLFVAFSLNTTVTVVDATAPATVWNSGNYYITGRQVNQHNRQLFCILRNDLSQRDMQYAPSEDIMFTDIRHVGQFAQHPDDWIARVQLNDDDDVWNYFDLYASSRVTLTDFSQLRDLGAPALVRLLSGFTVPYCPAHPEASLLAFVCKHPRFLWVLPPELHELAVELQPEAVRYVPQPSEKMCMAAFQADAYYGWLIPSQSWGFWWRAWTGKLCQWFSWK